MNVWKGCHFIFVYFVVCIVVDLVVLFDKLKRKCIDFIVSPFISMWGLQDPKHPESDFFFTLTYINPVNFLLFVELPSVDNHKKKKKKKHFRGGDILLILSSGFTHEGV